MSEQLEKRKWVYLQQPIVFGIPNCQTCGCEPLWSEFKDRLWCDKCQVDYQPISWGLFDGPIAIQLCAIVGISFDRLNLETNCVEVFNHHDNTYITQLPCQ